MCVKSGPPRRQRRRPRRCRGPGRGCDGRGAGPQARRGLPHAIRDRAQAGREHEAADEARGHAGRAPTNSLRSMTSVDDWSTAHDGSGLSDVTDTRRAPRSAAFGILIVRMPSLRSAETRATSMASGSANAREKRPCPSLDAMELLARHVARGRRRARRESTIAVLVDADVDLFAGQAGEIRRQDEIVRRFRRGRPEASIRAHPCRRAARFARAARSDRAADPSAKKPRFAS